MDTKGSAVIATREFVKNDFGESNYRRWLDSLPGPSRKIYSDIIPPNAWLPVKESLEIPTQKVCEMFYGGDSISAWRVGRFSADYGLQGVYRFFVQLGSPGFIVKKAAAILPTYYRPSTITVTKSARKSAVLNITRFDSLSEIMEYRIGGWMQKGIEISGGKVVDVRIGKSMANGDDETEYNLSWK